MKKVDFKPSRQHYIQKILTKLRSVTNFYEYKKIFDDERVS